LQRVRTPQFLVYAGERLGGEAEELAVVAVNGLVELEELVGGEVGGVEAGEAGGDAGGDAAEETGEFVCGTNT